jgi:RNA polymerase sigma-70 factor (ECF subfamily)
MRAVEQVRVASPLERRQVTRLLCDLADGDAGAAMRLFPLVYEDLRTLAAGYLRRERRGHTLQPTALVHESYCRLVEARRDRCQDRAQFFAVAARAMRQILIEHARRRRAAKRGGGKERLSLDRIPDLPEQRDATLLALDEALNELAALDERQSRIVELRFFGGLSIPETAEALGISHATVERDWKMAKAWLYREVVQGGGGSGER